MVNGITPRYLTNCLPPLVSTLNPYHRRNPLERSIQFCRTEHFKNTFFPLTTRDCNNLPEYYKVANSVAQFKRLLSTNDVTVPKLYYNSNRFVEVVHCRLRNEMSDLGGDLFQRHFRNDGACACGTGVENASHYFLSCPLHAEACRYSIITIPHFASITVKCLTHGDSRKTFAENKYIFENYHQFIVLSKRFQ